MTKMLYITALPYDETRSYSMAVGKAFIDSYKEVNPYVEVVHVDKSMQMY
jgi:FMN-dependent NADH-azoreductase